MKRKIINGIYVLLGMCAMVACSSPGRDVPGITVEQMQGIPPAGSGYLKGVSALYAGVVNGNLVMAGGCNFPDIPVADGGTKVYYQEVYAAPLTDEPRLEWKKMGRLPHAAAYGAAVSTAEGLVCIGGNTAERSLSDVFRLSLEADTLRIDTLPSLPVALDNVTGALLGNAVYVVGGNADGIPSADVYALDLADLANGWKRETTLPGVPRIQSVCAAQAGKLYVWGGFAAASEGREASLSVDGYAYNPETREWTSVATPCDAAGNEISLGGGVAVPYGDEGILCVGGVDKEIFLKALQGIYSGKEYLSHPVAWYRFNRNVLLYRLATDEWTLLGEYEQGARAGAALVSYAGCHYLIQGERKPGIRSNEINRFKENDR